MLQGCKLFCLKRMKLVQSAKMKRYIISLAVVVVLGGGGMILWKKMGQYEKPPVPEQVSFRDLARDDIGIKLDEEEISEVSEVDLIEEEVGDEFEADSPQPVEVPEELNLAAPFYAQAPFANWDYPWQEACEEASILLAANVYFEHEWTAEEFNEEILDMVDWQNEVFGDYWHTDMVQTARILDEHLGLESVMHEDPTFEDLKQLLAKGHFLIMPFDGKAMNNPFFVNGGPEYHVVLVKGYTADGGLITHDVGTRRGADYVYDWDVLDGALHDYVAGQPIQTGPRRFLEVLPPAVDAAADVTNTDEGTKLSGDAL